MNVLFHQSALADYQQWATGDIKVFTKISRLIIEITRTPFTGTGKPEPLRCEGPTVTTIPNFSLM